MQALAAQLRNYIDLAKLGRMAGPIAAAVTSRAGQTVLAFVLARAFGVEGYGEFIFAVGTAVLVSIAIDFGWPFVVNREMPLFIRDSSWELLRGLLRAADLFVFLVGLLGTALLLMAAEYVPHLALGLRGAAMLTIPTAIATLRQQQLAAVDRPTVGLLLDQGMGATLVLAIYLIHPMGVVGTLVSYSVCMVMLAVVGTVIFRSRLPREALGARPAYRLRAWLHSGWSMFASLMPRMLITRFDVLMVAPLAGLVQAGLFGSALRVTLLMTFPQFILQIVVMPRFSRAFAHGRHEEVKQYFRFCMIFALFTTIPLLLPMVVAPSWVMASLFGHDFAPGGPTLFWLGLGQFGIAFGTPLNAMIAMGGDHRSMGLQGVGVLLITLIGGWFLIPAYGATGAAVLTTFANLALTAGMAFLAYPLLSRRRPSSSQ